MNRYQSSEVQSYYGYRGDCGKGKLYKGPRVGNGKKKARAALAMVRVRGDVGEVCRTRHEGASKPPGECFDCSPCVMEEKGMT